MADLPGFHLAACERHGDYDLAGEGCSKDCPRLLHTRIMANEQITGWMGVEDIEGNVVLTRDPRMALKRWVVGDPFPVYRKRDPE